MASVVRKERKERRPRKAHAKAVAEVAVSFVQPSLPEAVAKLVHSTLAPEVKLTESETKHTLMLARGLLPPDMIYRICMTSNTTLGTTGAGVLNQAIALSPAVATYQEWNSFAALFDEVKMVSATLHLSPQLGSNGQSLNTASSLGLITNDVWVGYNPTNISTAPPFFTTVTRENPCWPAARTVGDRGSTTFTIKVPRGHGWASTATPAVASPPAGCVGTFDVANANALSINTTYYFATVHVVVLLRRRI